MLAKDSRCYRSFFVGFARWRETNFDSTGGAIFGLVFREVPGRLGHNKTEKYVNSFDRISKGVKNCRADGPMELHRRIVDRCGVSKKSVTKGRFVVYQRRPPVGRAEIRSSVPGPSSDAVSEGGPLSWVRKIVLLVAFRFFERSPLPSLNRKKIPGSLRIDSRRLFGPNTFLKEVIFFVYHIRPVSKLASAEPGYRV